MIYSRCDQVTPLCATSSRLATPSDNPALKTTVGQSVSFFFSGGRGVGVFQKDSTEFYEAIKVMSMLLGMLNCIERRE